MKTTPSRLRAWLQLIRPPNLFTVPGDAIAGNLIAGGVPGCAPDLQQVLLPALAVLFLYVGGLIGNDLADLAEDARDRPFRPLPGGRVSCAQARVAAVLCALTGLLLALAASRATFLAAVLTQLAILAALAALGLTLGACFSFPVAAFTATALLLVVLVAAGNVPDSLQEAFPAEAHPGVTEQISFAITRSVDALTRPLLQPEPLSRAVAGERVPAAELWRMLLWGGLVYPLVLSLIADRALRRREMARQSAG